MTQHIKTFENLWFHEIPQYVEEFVSAEAKQSEKRCVIDSLSHSGSRDSSLLTVILVYHLEGQAQL